MKKIKIKGKDYVMAHERVKEFHNLYKNGSIKTELIEMTDRFITKTIITPDVDNPDRFFTGYAYEDVATNGVNSTSALENCETSSCARALGMLNIGIDTSIASYEEVSNAIKQQNNKPKPIPKDVNPLEDEKHPLEDEVKEVMGGVSVEDGGETITFGKHKGKLWSEVDEGWLDWTSKNNDKFGDKAKAELKRRSDQAAKQADDEDVPF